MRKHIKHIAIYRGFLTLSHPMPAWSIDLFSSRLAWQISLLCHFGKKPCSQRKPTAGLGYQGSRLPGSYGRLLVTLPDALGDPGQDFGLNPCH